MPTSDAAATGPHNGWTGGQYSLLRGMLGVWLAWQFVRLWPAAAALARDRRFPDDPPETIWTTLPSIFALVPTSQVAQGVLVVAALLALLVAIGKWDRLAAVLAWYVWACCYAREPSLTGPAFPLCSWMLAAHVALPAAPFGSCDARGRVDPRGNWRMPDGVYLAVWGMLTAIHLIQAGQKVLAHGYGAGDAFAHHAAWTGLPAPLLGVAGWMLLCFQLTFGFAALWRPLRPVVWCISLLLTLASLCGGAAPSLVIGLALAHLLAFDPVWVPPRTAKAVASDSSGQASGDVLFYDGHCGLCQHSVRLVLAEDRTGAAFRYSPLGSELFQRLIPEAERAKLPDSMVIRQADGMLLTRSAGALYMFARLGGLWRVLATLGACVPRPLTDLAYAGVARVRHLVFTRPSDACPVMPADLRSRFEL